MTHDNCSCPIKSALEFVGLATATVIALVVVAFCSELGPMYVFWILGTTLACLITAASAVYFDAQHGFHGDQKEGEK